MDASRKIKYQQQEHYNVDALAPDNIDRLSTAMVAENSFVLELGCATGHLSKYLKHARNCKVVGVEVNGAAAQKAEKFVETMIVGNIEDKETWKRIKEKAVFDVVFASAVIEHLSDPWKAIENIRAVLKNKGELIITFPNVAHWRSRLRLLFGTWEYEEFGLFDSTHNKFFSLPSMRKMLEECGFFIVQEKYDPAGGAKYFTPILKYFPNAYAHQAVFKAVKK